MGTANTKRELPLVPQYPKRSVPTFSKIKSKIKRKEPLDRKWRSFGWQVLEIDGHNFMQIHHSFDVAEWTTDRPTVIIARTVKGKGLSFLEGDANSHNVSFSDEDLDWAIEELRHS